MKMMSLWITILMLTRNVSCLEQEWDDFLLYDEDMEDRNDDLVAEQEWDLLLYDEDYDRDYEDTEEDSEDDLVADLDYFLNYEEIARLSKSLNSSNSSIQLYEDFGFPQDDEILLDEAFDYDGDVNSDNVTYQDDIISEESKVFEQSDINLNWPMLVTGGVIFIICIIAITILIIILIIKKVKAKKNDESTRTDAEENPSGEIENEEV